MKVVQMSRGIQVPSVLLILLVLAGCKAPEVAVRSDEGLKTYKRVYLLPTRNDFRKLQPRVANRLRKMGFEVVEVTSGKNPLGAQGSGFVVSSEGHVLTSAHVVAGQTNVTMWIAGVRHSGHVLKVDTNLDAAVLLTDSQESRYRAVPLVANPDYHMGQEVFTMGFPLAEMLGTTPRLNKGLISSVVGLEDNPKQVQISAEVQPGNSGGPLLNEKGEAIGMVVATLNPLRVLAQTGGNLPQNVNFAVKADALQPLLAGIPAPTGPDEGRPSQAAFEAISDSIVLVRGGTVEDSDLLQRSLYSTFLYFSEDNFGPRLRGFGIVFIDPKLGKAVVRATARDDARAASEDSVLDQVFAEVFTKFFPDRPNPFRKR